MAAAVVPAEASANDVLEIKSSRESTERICAVRTTFDWGLEDEVECVACRTVDVTRDFYSGSMDVVPDAQIRRPFVVGTENKTILGNHWVQANKITGKREWGMVMFDCDGLDRFLIKSYKGPSAKGGIPYSSRKINGFVIDEICAFSAVVLDDKWLKVFAYKSTSKKGNKPLLVDSMFPNKMFTACKLMIVPQTGDLLVLMHMDNSVDCEPRFGRLYSVSVGRGKSVRLSSSFGLHADTSTLCTWHFFLDYLLCFLGTRLLAVYQMHFSFKQSKGKQVQILDKIELLPCARSSSCLAVELLAECPIGELLGESLIGQLSGRSLIGQVLGRWRGMWIVHDSVTNTVQFTNGYFIVRLCDTRGAWRPTIDLSEILMEQKKVLGKRLNFGDDLHVDVTLNRLQYANGFLFVKVDLEYDQNGGASAECKNAQQRPHVHKTNPGKLVRSTVKIDIRHVYRRPAAVAATETESKQPTADTKE